MGYILNVRNSMNITSVRGNIAMVTLTPAAANTFGNIVLYASNHFQTIAGKVARIAAASKIEIKSDAEVSINAITKLNMRSITDTNIESKADININSGAVISGGSGTIELNKTEKTMITDVDLG